MGERNRSGVAHIATLLDTAQARVAEFSLAPFSVGDKHYHSQVTEHGLCLSGQLQIEQPGTAAAVLHAGQRLEIAAQTVHWLSNPYHTPAGICLCRDRDTTTSSRYSRAMVFSVAANLVLITHLVFIGFVVFGGLLVLKWRWVAWLHIPCAGWGALLEFFGWFCPLTPLEQYLRRAAEQDSYTGGFIEHYLLSIIYPEGLTREIQIILGTLVVAINFVVYGYLLIRTMKRKPS